MNKLKRLKSLNRGGKRLKISKQRGGKRLKISKRGGKRLKISKQRGGSEQITVKEADSISFIKDIDNHYIICDHQYDGYQITNFKELDSNPWLYNNNIELNLDPKKYIKTLETLGGRKRKNFTDYIKSEDYSKALAKKFDVDICNTQDVLAEDSMMMMPTDKNKNKKRKKSNPEKSKLYNSGHLVQGVAMPAGVGPDVDADESSSDNDGLLTVNNSTIFKGSTHSDSNSTPLVCFSVFPFSVECPIDFDNADSDTYSGLLKKFIVFLKSFHHKKNVILTHLFGESPLGAYKYKIEKKFRYFTYKIQENISSTPATENVFDKEAFSKLQGILDQLQERVLDDFEPGILSAVADAVGIWNDTEKSQHDKLDPYGTKYELRFNQTHYGFG